MLQKTGENSALPVEPYRLCVSWALCRGDLPSYIHQGQTIMGTRSKALRTYVAESKEPRAVNGQGEIKEESQPRLKATGRPPHREERTLAPS